MTATSENGLLKDGAAAYDDDLEPLYREIWAFLTVLRPERAAQQGALSTFFCSVRRIRTVFSS